MSLALANIDSAIFNLPVLSRCMLRVDEISMFCCASIAFQL